MFAAGQSQRSTPYSIIKTRATRITDSILQNPSDSKGLMLATIKLPWCRAGREELLILQLTDLHILGPPEAKTWFKVPSPPFFL